MKQFFKFGLILVVLLIVYIFYLKVNSIDNKNTAHIQLKKTGQTKSYDENGNEVTDGSIKDDGYYQKGVSPSYTRNDTNEIVTDNLSGLMWQDNSDAITVMKPWLTQKNYDKCTGSNGQTQDSSKCIDTSGDTAATYCKNLRLGGYNDWRLPTSDELMYIVDRSRINPTLSDVFKNKRPYSYYWTSTPVVGDKEEAWMVSFDIGYLSESGKIYGNLVRCVRTNLTSVVSLANSNRYIRNKDGIVFDIKTRLQWQDDYSDNGNRVKKAKWIDAINYCENLKLGGYNDWRLPNFNELFYLANRSKANPAINSVFKNTRSESYWSSTSLASKGNNAFVVYFDSGGGYLYDKPDFLYVRCVRGGNK